MKRLWMAAGVAPLLLMSLAGSCGANDDAVGGSASTTSEGPGGGGSGGVGPGGSGAGGEADAGAGGHGAEGAASSGGGGASGGAGAGLELPGLYHLYPTGIVNGPGDATAFESCPAGYEYTAIVRLHDTEPCVAAIHVNANAWVGGDPEHVSVSALTAKGELTGAELKASWFRWWTAAGWEAYDSSVHHAAAARLPDGHGVFSLYYDIEEPPAEYPYEYGRLFLAGTGEGWSGLWRASSTDQYYLAAMASAADEATFLRLVSAGGRSYFDIAYGTRSGDLLYAQAVWTLDHAGLWQQVQLEGNPLRYRLDLQSGEFREWWTGSEAAPDGSQSFVRELDDGCVRVHDFATCNCSDPAALCYTSLCDDCGSWLPPR